MEMIGILIFWICYSSLWAGMTYSVSLFAGQKFNKEVATSHWSLWIFLPVLWLVWIILSAWTFFFRENEMAEIKKSARLILKRMFADWR
jgi:heme/copper-type cytochrome/quinol oxidase subunit 2